MSVHCRLQPVDSGLEDGSTVVEVGYTGISDLLLPARGEGTDGARTVDFQARRATVLQMEAFAAEADREFPRIDLPDVYIDREVEDSDLIIRCARLCRMELEMERQGLRW
jgi:hypothetical protein